MSLSLVLTFVSTFLFFSSLIPPHLSAIILVYGRRRVKDLDSMRKSLQFLAPVHHLMFAILSHFVVVLIGGQPILSAGQLLWIYFQAIVGTTAVVALVTDPRSPVLGQKPDKNNDQLFTINMIKHIVGQSCYQNLIVLILHAFGSQILGFDHTDDSSLNKHHRDITRTLIFNVIVFAQIFNSFNCRRLDQKLNVFEGMWRSWYFMTIVTIGIIIQVLICSVGGSVFGVTLGAREWVISIALTSVSLLLGALINLIPNERCEPFFKCLKLPPSPGPDPLDDSMC